VREVREECGLEVEVERWLGRVVRAGGTPGVEFRIDDYLCRLVGGRARPGDDADAICWADERSIRSLPLTVGLAEVLISWGFLVTGDDQPDGQAGDRTALCSGLVDSS
jgi:hypothetical protein